MYIGTFEIRVAEWTPTFNINNNGACSLYLLQAPSDQFGCKVNATEFGISSNISAIIGQRGYVAIDQEQLAPMVAMMVQEGYKRDVGIKVRSMAVVR
jgi:hypothetical protein